MALSLPTQTQTHSPPTDHTQLPHISLDRSESLQSAVLPLKDLTVVEAVSILPDSPSSGRALADISNRPVASLKHRQSSHSTSSTKQNRTTIFTLAALARDKTTSAIASFSEPAIRSRLSSSSLYRSAQSSPTAASNNSSNSSRSANSQTDRQDNTSSHNSTSSSPSTPTHTRSKTVQPSAERTSLLLETNPPSQAYTNTASDTKSPRVQRRSKDPNKMHQTSSRLLRMTSDDRPFTRVGQAIELDETLPLTNR